MKKIFKYKIPIMDQFMLELPPDVELLTVQMQHGTPQLWVLLDSDAQKFSRLFQWVQTGHPIVDHHIFVGYIGTVQRKAGKEVFHLFEKQA